jgi:hypothetical protein
MASWYDDKCYSNVAQEGHRGCTVSSKGPRQRGSGRTRAPPSRTKAQATVSSCTKVISHSTVASKDQATVKLDHNVDLVSRTRQTFSV